MTEQFALRQEVKSQGGIYIGLCMICGIANHIFIPGGTEFDLVDIAFEDIDPAIRARGEMNGLSDWRAPLKEEMMLAYINARHLFDACIRYWTASPYDAKFAWSVDLHDGCVKELLQGNELLVRPIRRVKAQ